MAYHRQRFTDASVMVFENHRLLAVLPANAEGNTLCSHQGLSYGGFLFSPQLSVEKTNDCIRSVLQYFHQQGFASLLVKPVPAYYHSLHGQPEAYAYFLLKAALERREISHIFQYPDFLSRQKRRKKGAEKALKDGLVVQEPDQWEAFYHLLETNLYLRYQVKPAHSLEELLTLKTLFPDVIRLYVATRRGQVLGGTLAFHMPRCIHLQYIATNAEGRETHALDLVVSHLAETFLPDTSRYISLGISQRRHDLSVNKGLTAWKESWGARPWLHDQYRLLTRNYGLLERCVY
jgi:hypothetical protein